MFIKIEISHSRKRLVKNDPIKTPKLQKAWKPDIIDFFDVFQF